MKTLTTNQLILLLNISLDTDIDLKGNLNDKVVLLKSGLINLSEDPTNEFCLTTKGNKLIKQIKTLYHGIL